MVPSSSNRPCPSDPGKEPGRALYLLCWVALAALLLLYALRPINDLDFWWHLKTGDLLIEQKGLLSIDPFNYTGDVIVRGREAVILNGYWLWQITASALYKVWGFNGIFLLKVVTAILMSWSVLFTMSRQLLSPTTRLILCGLGTLVVINLYNLERPQVFSIIFITLLLGMIARIRQGQPPGYLLFPLMIVWANIHGGFVIGDILLGLAGIGFLIECRHDRKRRLRTLAWAAGGILASFINPNGWNAFLETFNFISNPQGTSLVAEYRNSWFMFTNISRLSAVCLWILCALHLTGIITTCRRFWPEIFISLFIIAFGLKYNRNAGFIAVSLLPVTGWYLEQAGQRLKLQLPGQTKVVLAVACLAFISWTVSGEWHARKSANGYITGNVPVNMANFLKISGLSGNLFNEYGHGGFLDWALYPQWKTFIDGRELDTRVFDHYLKISLGSMDIAEGRRLYEVLLDRYQVDVVAIRVAFPDGHLQPLFTLLLDNPQWLPVYFDGAAFVMVRDTPRNDTAIRRLKIDKALFLGRLTELVNRETAGRPDNLPLSILSADILQYSNRLKEAGAGELDSRQGTP